MSKQSSCVGQISCQAWTDVLQRYEKRIISRREGRWVGFVCHLILALVCDRTHSDSAFATTSGYHIGRSCAMRRLVCISSASSWRTFLVVMQNNVITAFSNSIVIRTNRFPASCPFFAESRKTIVYPTNSKLYQSFALCSTQDSSPPKSQLCTLSGCL